MHEIYKYTNAIRKAIDEYQFPVDVPREVGHLTISCGIALFPQNADNMNTLISAAMQNVRASHSAGGNTIFPDISSISGDAGEKGDFLDIEILNAFVE